jgi:hypothetical protein
LKNEPLTYSGFIYFRGIFMAKQDVLKALLAVGEEKPSRRVHMKRFGVDFELKAIGGKEINRMREQSTFTTKKGKQLDEELFGTLILEKGCVEPNWNAKELTDKFGDSSNAIQSLLLAGEISKISAEILDLSGFNDDAGDEELKN